jgi:hypothetical protein
MSFISGFFNGIILQSLNPNPNPIHMYTHTCM